MPKFLKNDTIALLDGGTEAFLLGLYGMAMPTQRHLHKKETKYAPIIGLFGSSAELLVKACLVQAKGLVSMFRDGDITKGVYRFGNETIEDLRKYIRAAAACISYLWGNQNDHEEQKKQILHYLGKFKLLQELRANGLHAGLGCSRDIVVSTAGDIYEFILLLSQSKKLRPYLKNIPAPEATIRDREAIIEDLSRRFRSAKGSENKIDSLRSMYLVLPYIPEMKPDWVDEFDKIAVAPNTENDLTYLAKTLSDAHSIYLLKNRGGKDGIPVRVDPQNPDALPIAIQNIKRTLKTTPDKFNNDVLSANTRLEEGRLDLPVDDFLIDLYILGLEETKVLTAENAKLTAQQVWPFVSAAYSTNGTPRPCWFIIRACDEIDQLIAYVKKAEKYGNGYLRRRVPQLIRSLEAIKDNNSISFTGAKDPIFKEIYPYKIKCENIAKKSNNPFTPEFLRKCSISESISPIVHEYVVVNKNAGNALAAILEKDILTDGDRKACLALIPFCFEDSDKNGLVSILRTEHLKGYHSLARKMIFFADFLKDGPSVNG